jgi:hypothetical protein
MVSLRRHYRVLGLCQNRGVAETRRMAYDELVRRVIEHHRERGELVDFRLIPGGAIVAGYRVRTPDESVWRDLLPTDTGPKRYQETLQRLAPALFPGESVVIRTIRRGSDEARIEVEPGS